MNECRMKIAEMWEMRHVPLVYRAKFWLVFSDATYLHLAVHNDEFERLWYDFLKKKKWGGL